MVRLFYLHISPKRRDSESQELGASSLNEVLDARFAHKAQSSLVARINRPGIEAQLCAPLHPLRQIGVQDEASRYSADNAYRPVRENVPGPAKGSNKR